jgi:PAS domain S-box-containing protein
MEAIYTTATDGTIIDMNPAGISMFGFDSLDEFRKVNIAGLYADPNDRTKLIELAEKGPVKGFEVRLKKRDGTTFDALMDTYALKNSDVCITGFQGTVIDITPNKELQRTKEELTQALLQDVVRRKETEKMRAQFISTVTHELRTPLVSIKGYVDLALSSEPGVISKEVESQLQVAKRNTDRLLSLVNDLLDVQCIQAGRLQLNLQPTDFKKVVDSCIREIEPLVADKKQNLRQAVPEGKLLIQGDEVRLCQVLMNLLSNATKFSPEGSEVALHVEEEGETVKVSVSDNGIGISKEDLPRAFESFAAIQKPSYIKGTGLGLSVTKGLVEAHGGKIWVESPGEGKGATLTFTLPRIKEAS